MSAPAVSGISALLIEQYRITGGSDPLPSTIRALLAHTAVDMNELSTVYYNPGPDFASGYGRVDARAAIDAIRAGQMREDQLSNGQTDVYTLTVPADTSTLKVTLAWDDVPGIPNAIPALVNNLDLTLVAPDGSTTHFPWVLDPINPTHHATRGVDAINNIEQVQVDSPAAGIWQIRVSGSLIPQGPQLYSLVSGASAGGGNDTVGPITYAEHTIDDGTGNGDGIANPGETLDLTIALRNDGSAKANDVRATLSTDDGFVGLILTDTATYGDIDGGGTAAHAAPFGLRIKPHAPDAHAIQFSLTITANNGGPWTDRFQVTVQEGTGNETARVSLSKAVTPTTISTGELLTYTIRRSLELSGTHIYTETLIDPIPGGTEYVTESATVNGVPALQVYSPTLQSLYFEGSGMFTGNNELTLTFQVQVKSPVSLVRNTVTGTAGIDGVALAAPYTATAVATAGCTGLTVPILFAPPDGETGCALAPAFSWSEVMGADGYQIQLDDSSAFDSPSLDQTVTDTFYTLFNPLLAGTSYWRVRSYDACGESAWSEVWSLTLLSVPEAPTVLAPADGATTIDRTPNLTWDEVSGADRYSVQVDDDPEFRAPPTYTDITTTSFAPADDLETSTYYWRVQASGPCGISPWSSSRTLTIAPGERTYLPIILYGRP
jgi:uncharacterized repeat protein (TIGR01451 family)